MPPGGSLRVVAAHPASPGEEAIERALRPKGLAEYVGQAKAREQLEIFIGAARMRGEAMDHVLLFGPPGPRQDHAQPHHRQRARRQPALDLRAGAGEAQGPGGDPHQPREERRPLHRRDPPPLAGRRGDPLSGARGLPDRHHDRRRPGGALDQARAPALHPDRRDHPRRHAHQPAARPLRHRRPARVLQRRGAGEDRPPLGRPAQGRARRRGRLRDRPALARHAAGRQPAAAAGARLRRRQGRAARSPGRSPTWRWRCSTSTRTAST